MPHNLARERVEALYDRIFRRSSEIQVSDDNELSDEQLEELNICRIWFDPDSLANEDFVRSQDPPIFFRAMSQQKFDRHPIDLSIYGENEPAADFQEYNPVPNRYGHWRPFRCAFDTLGYLASYVEGFERRRVRPEALSLLELQGLERVRIPNSLFLYAAFTGTRSQERGGWWTCQLIVEHQRVNGRRVYPHLVLGVTQDFNGHENTMMYGELAPIVDAMHARLQQQFVPEEEEEALYDPEAFPPEGPQQFDREERFPILVLSFLGPQHARVFYACMDGSALVIRQSPLYSFERWLTAPMDLFARLVLSQPRST